MCHCFKLHEECLEQDETRRDSSLILMIRFYTVNKTMLMHFLLMFFLAVRMVAKMTETYNVISIVGFKICITIKY